MPMRCKSYADKHLFSTVRIERQGGLVRQVLSLLDKTIGRAVRKVLGLLFDSGLAQATSEAPRSPSAPCSDGFWVSSDML